ncbi:RHS repeat-associated core domain-containing protein [Lihuaxuella thermophila]|uniref:RHS repeat-associated core domain-containing protein n=1 Tax=Lihuaxuella thermophila TaxID=1173111 RepID=A0A1H8HM75_9BACL|nr:RHS repeat-associated core domain-containing protein [Lihuaxuella thermophila]SEN57362.1 RHS repeat-associated core domain-containing protein [Lihuaxuella thermophila]
MYDAENRLTAVKDSSGATIASFTYRADGMRKTMTTSSGTITFHYDEDNNVTYESDASNNVVARYTYNSNNQPVSMTRGGKTYYYQLNYRDGVVALTDANGAVVATYEYDAYGNLIKETGTVENPYRYAGYRYDKVTGLYYLQSRYYNPEVGRFLSRDTFEGFDDEPLSQNRYIYVNNNPVKFVDNDGQYRRYVSISRRSMKIYLSHRWLDMMMGFGTIGGALKGQIKRFFGKLASRVLSVLVISIAVLWTYSDYHGYKGVTISISLVYKHWYAKYKNYRTGKYWWGSLFWIAYPKVSIRPGKTFRSRSNKQYSYSSYGYYY